jgi:hypothetical protein
VRVLSSRCDKSDCGMIALKLEHAPITQLAGVVRPRAAHIMCQVAIQDVTPLRNHAGVDVPGNEGTCPCPALVACNVEPSACNESAAQLMHTRTRTPDGVCLVSDQVSEVSDEPTKVQHWTLHCEM